MDFMATKVCIVVISPLVIHSVGQSCTLSVTIVSSSSVMSSMYAAKSLLMSRLMSYISLSVGPSNIHE